MSIISWSKSSLHNKDLLYRTGNYLQYLVTNYSGKRIGRKDSNHFAVYLKLTQYYKSAMLCLKKKKSSPLEFNFLELGK